MRDPMAWKHQAACRGLDPEVFFPDEEEAGDADNAICIRCPVRQPCLEWALASREKQGVWGGLDEEERREIRRARRRSLVPDRELEPAV